MKINTRLKILLLILLVVIVGVSINKWRPSNEIDSESKDLLIETTASAIVDTIPKVTDILTEHDDENNDSIPHCDPVREVPIIDIATLPKTCRLSKKIRGLLPIPLNGESGRSRRNFVIHSGKVYEEIINSENPDETIYGDDPSIYTDARQKRVFGDGSTVYYTTGECKKSGETYDYKEIQNQEDYAYLLKRYGNNNILESYMLRNPGELSPIVNPSSISSNIDTYYRISNYNISPQIADLASLGYTAGYLDDGRIMLAFRGRLYNPFYDGDSESASENVDFENVDSLHNNIFSTPRKITGWNSKTNKLIFTRQKNILITYGEDGEAVLFHHPEHDREGNKVSPSQEDTLIYNQYQDKYGPDDYGYVATYNIETCTEK